MSKAQKLEDFSENLEPGTELLQGQFTVEKYLNAGGFGITYLARDSLDRMVVIKECFPGTICRRHNASVAARSNSYSTDFKSAIDVFVREAKNLSKLSHRNIVRVHQVFEENNTAYMVIDYIEGRDLQDMIEDSKTKLPPEFIIGTLKKLLDAVDSMHAKGILHRDISPDNILIREDKEPILIDFGAAREESSKKSRVLSNLHVVKDGYSPQEFYVAGSMQSNASDLYALGATFYHAIAGEMPPNSQIRLAAVAEGNDGPYKPLAGRFPDYPLPFLAAIDKALEVIPKNRLQSASEWLLAIDPDRQGRVDPAVREAVRAQPKSKMPAIAAAAAAVLLIGGGAAYFMVSGGSTSSELKSSTSLSSPASDSETAPVAVVEAEPVDIDTLVTSDKPTLTTLVEAMNVETPAIVEEDVQKTDIEPSASVEADTNLVNEGTAGTVVDEGIEVAKVAETEPVVAPTEETKVVEESEEDAITPIVSQPLKNAETVTDAEPADAVVVEEISEPLDDSTAPVVDYSDVQTQADFVVAAKTDDQTLGAILDGASASDAPVIALPNSVASLAPAPRPANLPTTSTVVEETVEPIKQDQSFAQRMATMENIPDSVDREEAPIFELISPVPVQPETVVEEQVASLEVALEQPTIAENAEALEIEQIAKPVFNEQTSLATSNFVEIGNWQLDIPFVVGEAVGDSATGFPVITVIKPFANLEFAGDWLKPGVTIFSLNGELVSSAEQFEDFMNDVLGQTAPEDVAATVRIKRTPDAEAEDVVLQMQFRKPVTLANGVVLDQKRVKGKWRLIARNVPEGVDGLKAGDLLLTERNLELDLTSALQFSRVLKHLQTTGLNAAELEISRRGTKSVTKINFTE